MTDLERWQLIYDLRPEVLDHYFPKTHDAAGEKITPECRCKLSSSRPSLIETGESPTQEETPSISEPTP